jgi:import inner membrane translocase subunit TIM16
MSESFSSAMKIALQNTKSGGGPNTIKASVSYKMKPDEAYKILDINKTNITRKVLKERYDKFYELNDPDKGGSFYLRSKVYRAKEALDRELDEIAPKKSEL